MAARLILFLLAAITFVESVRQLDRWPQKNASPEMEVVLPRSVQIAMVGGDRYLAANLGGVRSLVVDTQRLDREGFRNLALVQKDVAWLNPAHEDNYYIAAAVLSWNGELEAAQYILGQAAEARPFDMWPSFYYGFNLYHFLGDPLKAAEWLRLAATRTGDEYTSLALNDLASRWVRKGADRRNAIAVLNAMAQSARIKGFANHLRKHVRRLENLIAIEDRAERYRKRHGELPATMASLARDFPEIARLEDPFGGTYLLDAQGKGTVKEKQ